MIQIHQLIYKYPKGVEISFPDFEIKSGEEILILGASGCGKTTLLHVLGGLLPATSGKVIINDTDITQLTGSKVDQFRGKNIGVIFQKPHFARALTVKENLAFAQKAGGKKVDSGRIKQLLERLGIAQHIDNSPSNMSEGEKQRLSVAMALINKPALLLADEPTASLDDEHANEVIQLLREMASEENSALAIVTHDSRLKEAFAERTLTLSKLH
ncbi:ATP-binding cassette domain-containing protein [Flammeovirga sp. MY04]|uniref:ABC transporter ATP-binding protein n=1 Tax=Flammeovirga sp. MY04 TaxID=1191459 RepID=UPI0008064303|nr:ATP-binding cassette domain-containing protein [Flammeovirga sp. MY04]ANQ50907.1 ATP-binding cassette domain-containing protein [Flammeovirga sp. MY04]